jgi:uncharacterized protein YegP (UPF0339 family)
MKFKVSKAGKGKWKVQLVGGNGKVLMTSDTYARKRNAVETIGAIKAGAPWAKTEEVL